MFQHKFDQKFQFGPILTFLFFTFWGKVTKVQGERQIVSKPVETHFGIN